MSLVKENLYILKSTVKKSSKQKDWLKCPGQQFPELYFKIVCMNPLITNDITQNQIPVLFLKKQILTEV